MSPGESAMRKLIDVLNARPRDRVIAAPGVYDMVSLRMAAAMGFDALYMTGYGTVASHLGLPDAGLASYADMVGRVEAMARMAGAPLIADFLIIARTDARGSLGLAEAIRRARAYAKAGADMLFVESPESEAEMAEIGRELGDMPLVANMVEGGRTPILSNRRLAEIGYALAIYPVAGLLSAAAALNIVYAHIRDTGSSLGSPAPLYPFAEMNRLMGFEEVWAFDKAHAEI